MAQIPWLTANWPIEHLHRDTITDHFEEKRQQTHSLALIRCLDFFKIYNIFKKNLFRRHPWKGLKSHQFKLYFYLLTLKHWCLSIIKTLETISRGIAILPTQQGKYRFPGPGLEFWLWQFFIEGICPLGREEWQGASLHQAMEYLYVPSSNPKNVFHLCVQTISC